MFDFGIDWTRDVSLPDSEYGAFDHTLIRFRCGCELIGDVSVAAPNCPLGHAERYVDAYEGTRFDFETEDERLERERREEEEDEARWCRYLASEAVRNAAKKAKSVPIDGRPMTREDVLEVVRAGGKAIAADAQSYAALYRQKLVYKKPLMKLQDGFNLYRIRIGARSASRSSI